MIALRKHRDLTYPTGMAIPQALELKSTRNIVRKTFILQFFNVSLSPSPKISKTEPRIRHQFFELNRRRVGHVLYKCCGCDPTQFNFPYRKRE